MHCRKNGLIKLPKTKRDPKETEGLCQCRPICKSRRRDWHGMTLNCSAELLLERKPVAECFRRLPTKVYPNSPCSLLGRSRRMVVKERGTFHEPDVVRLCTAPIDDTPTVPYLALAEIAKNLGAWNAVNGCAFCPCEACPCSALGYQPRDADRALSRRDDMRHFDKRVRTECLDMKIMICSQVVSDWVTCILSVLCCQCWQAMPLSTATSVPSHSTVQEKPEPLIDLNRASGEPLRPQCTTIDFTPQPKDTDEMATRCNQFWDFIRNQPELEGIMVTSR